MQHGGQTQGDCTLEQQLGGGVDTDANMQEEAREVDILKDQRVEGKNIEVAAQKYNAVAVDRYDMSESSVGQTTLI